MLSFQYGVYDLVTVLGLFLLNLELMLVNCRQLRNLEKAFGGDVRVCDRTALILDIFSQRAATREATLQVRHAT